jgi:hypothetical protein
MMDIGVVVPLIALKAITAIMTLSQSGTCARRTASRSPAQSDGSLESLVGTQSTASRGRMQLAGLAIRFPIAAKARLLGIISAEFVAEELAGGVAPNLQLSVQDW